MADSLPAAIEDESFDFYGRRIRASRSRRSGTSGSSPRWAVTWGGCRPALRRRDVPAVGQGPCARDGRPDHRGDARAAESRRWMATRRVPAASPSWTRFGEDRLPGLVARLVGPGHRSHVLRREPPDGRSASSWHAIARRSAEPVDLSSGRCRPHAVNAYSTRRATRSCSRQGSCNRPMFDAEADDAVNYGGIGTVIAHRDHPRVRRPGPTVRRSMAPSRTGGRTEDAGTSPSWPIAWSSSTTRTSPWAT